MRLPTVTQDIPFGQKLLFGTLGLVGVHMLMGRVMGHRPVLFADPFSALSQATLRSDSPWTIFEREMFAGFCSAVVQCPF